MVKLNVTKRITFAVTALVTCLGLTACFIRTFATDHSEMLSFSSSGEVTLDGSSDAQVTVSLTSAKAQKLYTAQGVFSITENDDSEQYFTANSFGPASAIASYSQDASTETGQFFYQYPSAGNGVSFNADDHIYEMVYNVKSNTPAGTYHLPIEVIYVQQESLDDYEEFVTVDATVTVTRNDTPAGKLPQTIVLRDEGGNDISGTIINKHYGDERFKVTWEHVVGDGEVSYHPDDDETSEHVARTAGDYIEIDNVGSVNICAWANETEDYAAAQACITVNVSKRPLDIVSATIADKTFDGTTDATVTDVTFEDRDISDAEYTATAEFGTADAGEDKGVRVRVTLVGNAVDHYILNSNTFDTTKTISPFMLTAENAELLGGTIYAYNPNGVEPEVRVTANIHGGVSTLVEGEDFNVVYSDNQAVGTGHAAVTGAGNFTTGENPLILDFTITKKGINNSNLTVPSSLVEGRILTPNDVSVNVDGHNLVRCESVGDTGCDYVLEISGENDGVIGHTVHVAINACNNYDGVAVADIDIVAKQEQTVTIADVTDTTVNKTYGDTSFTYTATTTGDGAISYQSTNESVATVDAESGAVTIVGVGDADIVATAAETDTYAEATAKYTVSVAKKVITVTNATVPNKVYDGTTLASVESVTLSESSLTRDTDYVVAGVFNDSSVGVRDVSVMVTLNESASKNYCFMIQPSSSNPDLIIVGPIYTNLGFYTTVAAITPFTLTAENATADLTANSFVYNGSEKTPVATVTVDLDGDGIKEVTLEAGTDYEINYEDNVNAGMASATITGKGNYTGSLDGLTFEIIPAPVENVVVAAPAQDYTGEALEPVPTVTGEITGNAITLTAGDYEVVAHEAFINAGDYTFTVKSANGSNYYIANTDGTFKINKIASGNPPEATAGLKIEAGKTLADLGERTPGFSWNSDTTEVGLGDGVYGASYLKNNDATNYILSEDLGIPVRGLKRIAVTTVSMAGGTATSSSASVLEGENVTFTFAPDEGYELYMVMVGEDDRIGDVSDSQLTIVAGTEDIMMISYYRRVYEVIKGAGQTHVISVDGAAEFEIDADYGLFEDTGTVYVDGKLLDEEKYESRDGSTIITLKADYLDTLAIGEHLLEVQFDDGGIARTTFIIAEKEEENPDAADTGAFTKMTDGAVVASVSVIAVAVIAGGLYFAVKRNKRA